MKNIKFDSIEICMNSKSLNIFFTLLDAQIAVEMVAAEQNGQLGDSSGSTTMHVQSNALVLVSPSNCKYFACAHRLLYLYVSHDI